jgi:hypothetical protein
VTSSQPGWLPFQWYSCFQSSGARIPWCPKTSTLALERCVRKRQNFRVTRRVRSSIALKIRHSGALALRRLEHWFRDVGALKCWSAASSDYSIVFKAQVIRSSSKRCCFKCSPCWTFITFGACHSDAPTPSDALEAMVIWHSDTPTLQPPGSRSVNAGR